ncbi:MAG: adenylate/guanylate cyclase domain-containing protein [Alphaproteobacteria bacterium]|nr:adenylate/guanylate cyclase domain-containing protein [Alphaproteobacteria bacterium]
MPETFDFDRMSLRAFMALQQDVAKAIKRRFEREIAVVFTDVVGSTAYFDRFGDAAGRSLVERHHTLLRAALAANNGRIIDTAGDGAFCVAESAFDGASALIRFQESIADDNAQMPESQTLRVRAGLHWGTALVDGDTVTGDAINFTARVAGSAEPTEIRISEAAYSRLPPELRYRCRPLPLVSLKGYAEPARLLTLAWRDPSSSPDTLVIEETGQRMILPDKEIISAGRLAQHEGRIANDLILSHPDPQLNGCISRWHFQLERTSDGLLLRQLSRGLTEVDDAPVAQGDAVSVQAGSTIRVAKVLTMRLVARSRATQAATVYPGMG